MEIMRGQINWVRISDSKQGRWCQEILFNSILNLKCPPTFDMGLIKISVSVRFISLSQHLNLKIMQYSIEIKIPYPGVGNVFTMTVPLGRISSGMSNTGSGSTHEVLELPP